MGLLNWFRSGVTASRKSKAVVSDLTDIAVPGSWPSARPAATSEIRDTNVNDIKPAADTTQFPQRLDTRTLTGQTLNEFRAASATSVQVKHPLRSLKNDRYGIYRKWAAESRAQKEVGLANPAVESAKEMKLKRKAYDEVLLGPEKKKVRFVEGHTELRGSGVQESLILKQVDNIGKKRKAEDVIDSTPTKRQLIDPNQSPPLDKPKAQRVKRQPRRPVVENRSTFRKWQEYQLRAAGGQRIVVEVRKEEVAEAKKPEGVQPVPHLVVTSYDHEQLEAARAAETRLEAVETELRSTQAKLSSTTASLMATDGVLNASKESLETAQRLLAVKDMQLNAQADQLANVTLAAVVALGSGEQEPVNGEDAVEELLDGQIAQPSAPSIAVPEQFDDPVVRQTQINTALGNASAPWIPPPPVALSELLPNGGVRWFGRPSAPTVPVPDAFGDFVEARTADDIARREVAAPSGIESLLTKDDGDVATGFQPESADPMELDRSLSTDAEPSQRDLSLPPKPRSIPPTEPRAMRIEAARQMHLKRLKARSVHWSSKLDDRPGQLAGRMPPESMVLDDEDEHMADDEHRPAQAKFTSSVGLSREVDMLSPAWLSDGVDEHDLSSDMDVDVQPGIQPSPETEYVHSRASYQRRFQPEMTGRRLDASRAASSQGIRKALDEDVHDSTEPNEISSLYDERTENAAKRLKAKGYDAPRSNSLIPFRLEQGHDNGYHFPGAHGRRAGHDNGRQGDAQPRRRGERDSLGDIMPRASRNALEPDRDGRLPSDRFNGLRSL
ncbi:hypothetical protein LTR86_000978 [Recurvomyces mirabilis]|nr:hypothetical protein LTR86_000978 [Recurvomyces mirabilis]